MSAPAVSIDLDKLPEETRNQIIARSARDGVSTKEVMQDMISGESSRAVSSASAASQEGGSR